MVFHFDAVSYIDKMCSTLYVFITIYRISTATATVCSKGGIQCRIAYMSYVLKYTGPVSV